MDELEALREAIPILPDIPTFEEEMEMWYAEMEDRAFDDIIEDLA